MSRNLQVQPESRERGAFFIVVAVLVVLMAGLASAFFAMSTNYHTASRRSLETETAFQIARSGVNYLLAEFASEPTYFDTLGTLPTRNFGSGSFELESVAPDGGTRWDVVVVGRLGATEYRIAAAIGFGQTLIPGGLVIGGTGSPTFNCMSISGAGAKIASYDSEVGAYNAATPGSNADVSVHGSVTMSTGALIHGTLEATGTVTASGGASATLGHTASATLSALDDIDPFVVSTLAQSQASNDNSALGPIFGAQWSAIFGAENYGDLIVNGGNFVVPAGTYRFRRFEVRGGATVTFDTSTGPVNICYIGSGTGTGSGNDLQVDDSSHVVSQSGTTQNLLRTILAADCDFFCSNNSIFGQNLSDPNSAGYSQLVSLGGNTSADVIGVDTGAQVFGRLYARAHDVSIASNGSWYGSGVIRELALDASSGTATFAVDESLLGRSIPQPDDHEVYGTWNAQ